MSQPTPAESQRLPADEPYESQDLELGAALRSWVEAQQGSLDLILKGPLDTPGMDPTWILRPVGRGRRGQSPRTPVVEPPAVVAAIRPAVTVVGRRVTGSVTD